MNIENQATEMIKVLTKMLKIQKDIYKKCGYPIASRGSLDVEEEGSEKQWKEWCACQKRLREIGEQLLDVEGVNYQGKAWALVEMYFLQHRELCVTGYIPKSYVEDAWEDLNEDS